MDIPAVLMGAKPGEIVIQDIPVATMDTILLMMGIVTLNRDGDADKWLQGSDLFR